jgi:hypothetical protein
MIVSLLLMGDGDANVGFVAWVIGLNGEIDVISSWTV